MTTEQQTPDEFAGLADLLRDEQVFPGGRAHVDPEVRRRRRRRRAIVTLIVIAIVLATGGGYVGWALTVPVPAPLAASQTPGVPAPGAAVLDLPTDGASAVSVSGADQYLGANASGLWATSGTDEPRSIASITKLITALVVLDAHPLAGASDPGPTITFDKAAHDLYDKYYVMGATIAPMPTGTRMSLRSALAIMLIPSASNYAEAVSTWAFGSQSRFLGATRDWLAANGLTGTTIVEPTGISPRNTSTASDLITLGKLAAANPVIAAIVATGSVSVPGEGVMTNTNSLLGSGGITGLKTGNLGENSYNLLYSATLGVGAAEPLTIIGVILGGSSRDAVNADVRQLLDSIRGGFHDVQVAERGQEVGSYSTPWGSTARMVVAENATIFTWSDTPITATMTTTTPADYEDGDVVGSITWTAGPHTETVPIEIDGTIDPPTAWWRLTNPSELWGG